MPAASDRRSKPRVFVGPEHTIQFVVKGHAFHNVRLTNLSEDGCFATIPRRSASLFFPNTILEQLAFEHPALPHAPITAKVSYALAEQPGMETMPFIGLGIHFMVMAPETADALQKFIATQGRG